MHKRKSRRKQIALRSFTYGFMTLAVIVSVLFTLSWVMGFRFDWNNREISQISLLQFGSFPSGASVDINGKAQPFRTPGRQNVKTGHIDIKITKDEYHDWFKSINLRPSEVRWITYPRLIPKEVVTDQVKSFSEVHAMLPSHDQRWLLIQTTESARTFVLADISDPKNVRFSTLAIAADALSELTEGQTERFSIVEWNGGSRYILIKRTIDDKTEFIKLDRRNSGVSQNLTREFNMDMADPHFSGNSGNVFYALTGTDLRKFDLGNKLVSAPLVSDVTAYRAYDNKLVYVGLSGGEPREQVVGIHNDGENVVVRTYDEEMPTLAEFARYEDKEYLAIGRGETVSIITAPLSNKDEDKQVTYLSSPGGIDFMMFNRTGRFVVAGLGDKLVSYDQVTGENYSYAIPGLSGKPEWLDDYYLVDTTGGNIGFIEFDGGNHNHVVSGRGRVTLSSNNKYLFSINSTSDGAVLQRSSMVVDN